MSGTALVTIAENQWNVELATTTTELTTGLSGRASLAAGTGMLFVLPAAQVVTVQTNEMLFPLDMIFIKDDLVLDIASGIEPGLLVEEATPCDGFLEVNSGEADLVEVGDAVVVEITTPPPSGFDIGSIIAFALPLTILGFVSGMLFEKRPAAKKGTPKKLPLASPQVTEKQRGKELQEKKLTLESTGKEMAKEAGVKFLRLDEGWQPRYVTPRYWFRDAAGNKIVASDLEELRWKLSELVGPTLGFAEHHSIHGPERDRLVGIYGSWAIGRAESVCPVDDVQCVEHEAAQFLTKFKASRWA